MADVKESALTQQSDCKWVRALDANGNSIRISKEDLASVVGGLLGEPMGSKGTLTENINDIIDSGNYAIFVSGSITPSDNLPELLSFGHLLVFGSTKGAGNGANPVVQIAVSADATSWIRIKWINSWSSWKSITL